MTDSLHEPLTSRHGQVNLLRLPQRRREWLRAWDTADQYLLDVLEPPSGPPLIVNDNFGALAVSLAAYHPWSRSDSWLAHRATAINLERNDWPTDQVRLLDSLQPFCCRPSAVLLRVPRHLSLLAFQLHELRPLLNQDTPLLLGGMVKHMPAAVWELAESIIGPTHTHLARKKARVIQVSLDAKLRPEAPPSLVGYDLAEEALHLEAWPNVFSRQRLDIGSRFFLNHMPKDGFDGELVDLGCGNGVLGLVAARHYPKARLHFVDESWMAICSAQSNFQRHFGQRPARFVWGDGLADYAPGSVQRVFCNPPFHQQQVVGDHLARPLFRQAFNALDKGGELWVVGNRHLGYHKRLRQLFGNCRTVASSTKFVVLMSQKIL